MSIYLHCDAKLARRLGALEAETGQYNCVLISHIPLSDGTFIYVAPVSLDDGMNWPQLYWPLIDKL